MNHQTPDHARNPGTDKTQPGQHDQKREHPEDPRQGNARPDQKPGKGQQEEE